MVSAQDALEWAQDYRTETAGRVEVLQAALGIFDLEAETDADEDEEAAQ